MSATLVNSSRIISPEVKRLNKAVRTLERRYAEVNRKYEIKEEYWIIDGDTVIDRVSSIQEAIERLHDRPSAVAIEIGYSTKLDIKKLREQKKLKTSTAAYTRSHERRNPIGELVYDLTEDDQWTVKNVIDDEFGTDTLMDGLCNNGQFYEGSGPTRVATNEESAFWHVEFTIGQSFDMRRSLVAQMRKWLNRVAVRLAKTCSRIEPIEESADKRLIRTLVNDPTALQRLIDEGKVVRMRGVGSSSVMTADNFEQSYPHAFEDCDKRE